MPLANTDAKLEAEHWEYPDGIHDELQDLLLIVAIIEASVVELVEEQAEFVT